MDDSILKIGILGPLRVVVAGVERRIASRKQRQLLAELVLGRGQSMPRDDLLLALWPDSDEQHARDSLRHALWQLRRELGPAAGMLRAQGGRLTLDQQVDTDVATFERLASSDRPDDLLSALDVYQGDLCRELESEQAEVERERLRRLFVVAGSRLAASELEAGNPAAVVEIARRVLRHDPFREEVHRQLLQALAAAGDLPGLAAHYRGLGRTLREELGVEPSPETQALYENLMRGGVSAVVAPVRQPRAEPPPSLVGRRAEYRQLVEALIDSVDRRGLVVQIGGEAGAGKTRLLDELSQTAADHGFRVVTGRAVGVEGQLGYQVWVDALRPFTAEAAELPAPWPGVLAALLPDLAETGAADPGQVAPQLERTRLFEGIAKLLARLAGRVPTLIALDDLHWADADALHLLHYLARNLRAERITIVTAARPIPSGANQALTDVLNNLRSTELLLDITLGPLDLAGVTALLEQAGLTQDTAGLLGPRIAAWTSGNPFFVLEATRALVEQGSLHRGLHGRLEWDGAIPDSSEPLAAQLPRGVRETILSRVDILPEDTRLVLNVASAIGRTVAPEVLSIVSGRDEFEILDLLAPALMAGLLSETVVAGRLELMFIHDLVREAIYQQQPAIIRAAVHRRVAAAIETQTAPSAVVAHHLTAAGETDRAADFWLMAGTNAAAYFAHEEAIRAFEQALATLPEHDLNRRVTALESLGATHVRRGAIADALRSYDLALSLLADNEDAGRVARLWSRIALTSGRYYGKHPRALEYAEAAVAYYTARDAPLELSEALISRASMQYQTLDAEGARQTALEALKLSRQLDRPRHEAAAQHVLTWAQWFSAADISLRDLSAFDLLIERLGKDEEVAYLQQLLAERALDNGDLSLARQRGVAALDIARQVGSLRGELLALESVAAIDCHLGQPDTAQQFVEQALDLARRLGHDEHRSSVVALRSLAAAHALLGNVPLAIEIAWKVFTLEEAEPGAAAIHLSCRIEACRVFLLAGRPDLVPEPTELHAERPICRRCTFSWLAVAGQRQAWSDDPSAALPLASELDGLVSVTGAKLFAGWVPYIRALALCRLGKIDEAEQYVREAATAFQSIGHNWGLKMLARDLQIPAE